MATGNGAGRTPMRDRRHCRIISLTPDHLRDTRFTKRQNDMLSEQTMRFFTPELYLRFNSPDDAVAMAADAEWETAITRYNAHLESFRSKMPSQVVALSKMCLHDAEVLSRQGQQEPFELAAHNKDYPWAPWHGVFTLAVRHADQVLAVLYFLRDHVAEKPPTQDWPFSKSREHWLYDEIDYVSGAGEHFIHHVLLSTGVVLSIPFTAVLIMHFPVAQAESEERSKQTA
jgi:hypothetical protein